MLRIIYLNACLVLCGVSCAGLSENRKPVPDVNTELWLCSGDNHTGVVKVLNYSGHNSEPKVWIDTAVTTQPLTYNSVISIYCPTL